MVDIEVKLFKQITRCEKFQGKENCEHGHCSAISNSSWCDSNSNRTILKLQDLCPNIKDNCQNQTKFTARRFELEDCGFESNYKKNLQKLKQHGLFSKQFFFSSKFFIAVANEIKNLDLAQATKI